MPDYVEHSDPVTTANGGCYQCSAADDGVTFDRTIVGEGVLFLCFACLSEANKLCRAGHARHQRQVKADQRARVEQ